jgi:hypothetical protein
MRTFIDSDNAPLRTSIDALLEVYLSWRAECHAVWQAYQSWSDSDRSQRALAYAWYVAALDREDHAASAYAHQIERVSRICV